MMELLQRDNTNQWNCRCNNRKVVVVRKEEHWH